LGTEADAFLTTLFDDSKGVEFNETGINNWIREAITASGIDNKVAYTILYRLFLESDRGPRLASLLAAMDRVEVFSILEKAIEMLE